MFKKEYKVTSATMNVLATALGEDFFSLVKMPCTKNKNISQLSPFVEEFFRVFPMNKGNFIKPTGKAWYCPFDSKDDTLSPWQEDKWKELMVWRLKQEVMDFRMVPFTIIKGGSSLENPYIYEFMSILGKVMDPYITDPLVWL